MNCPGLHCAGCRDGSTARVIVTGTGVLTVVALAEWVIAHAWYVLAVTATCFALAVWAVVALMRWGDRREARHALEHPFLTAREPAGLTAPPVWAQAIPDPAAPAIENHFHIHVGDVDGDQAASALIRAALPGTVRDSTPGSADVRDGVNEP